MSNKLQTGLLFLSIVLNDPSHNHDPMLEHVHGVTMFPQRFRVRHGYINKLDMNEKVDKRRPN